MKNNNKSNPIKKSKKSKNYTINVIQTGSFASINKNIILNDNSKNNINLVNNKNIENNIMKLNIYELNNLSYNDALKKDKRNYIEYYISLLKTKHLIIFTFCLLNDYNSKFIKIDLFFFSFTIYFTINALFFNDNTMHKIYIDNGSYNFSYQIVQIIYSTIISTILNIILKYLALSESNILYIKISKKSENLNEKSKKVIKILTYKFISFFIISTIFIFFFLYYISSFCAIYSNTQIHLIKDTIISFGLNMITPFILCLLPGIFRIPSLRKSGRETMYKFSKILQLF